MVGRGKRGTQMESLRPLLEASYTMRMSSSPFGTEKQDVQDLTGFADSVKVAVPSKET
jgi:hypothetical protein